MLLVAFIIKFIIKSVSNPIHKYHNESKKLTGNWSRSQMDVQQSQKGAPMKIGIIVSASLLTLSLAGCQGGGAAPTGPITFGTGSSGAAAAPASSGATTNVLGTAAVLDPSVVNPAVTKESLNDAVKTATGPNTNLVLKEGALTSGDSSDSVSNPLGDLSGKLGAISGAANTGITSTSICKKLGTC